MRRAVRGRLTALASVLGVLAAGLVAAPTAVADEPEDSLESSGVPDTFVLTGSGWGHGIGMSQYGAYGQALDGRTAEQIVEHYYSPATLESYGNNPELRVKVLTTSKTTVTKISGTWRLKFGPTAADVVVMEKTTSITFTASSGVVSTVVGGKTYRTSSTMPELYLEWSGTRYLSGAAGVVSVPNANGGSGTVRYRNGRLALRPVTSASMLDVINPVLLHSEYLYGLAEMPSSWPGAALQSQAIAGRTYALDKYLRNKADPTPRTWDVTDEVDYQKYTAWNKQNETTWGARWVAAVDATRSGSTGKVVMYNGKPIQAYFSSSTGGKTTSVSEGWGSSQSTYPYLSTRDDHWAIEPEVNNSRARWVVTLTQARVSQIFGVADVKRLEVTQRAASGAVMQLKATTSAGAVDYLLNTPKADSVRTALGLNSAYFSVGFLSEVQRLAGADRHATAVAIGRAASSTSQDVVVVSGVQGSLVDGLVAAPFAATMDAPVLLTARDALPKATADEIRRRGATRAWIVGGTGVVSKEVAAQLRTLGLSVTRLSGSDRYSTAAAVAARFGTADSAVVASGAPANLVDAAAAGGPAAASGQPVLLVAPDALPASTKAVAAALGVQDAVVVGGVGAVSKDVVQQLRVAGISPVRLSGSDRFATAAAVASYYVGSVGDDTVLLASGLDANLVDSLTGGVLGHVTLLTNGPSAPAATAGWLDGRNVPLLRVAGGEGAVPSSVVEALR